MKQIDPQHWDNVSELAAAIATASMQDDDILVESKTAAINVLLDELEVLYPNHPSLQATRADYADNPASRIELLISAYRFAEGFRDRKNQVMIAISLVEEYKDQQDWENCSHWLAIAKNHATMWGRLSEKKEIVTLERDVREERKRKREGEEGQL